VNKERGKRIDAIREKLVDIREEISSIEQDEDGDGYESAEALEQIRDAFWGIDDAIKNLEEAVLYVVDEDAGTDPQCLDCEHRHFFTGPDDLLPGSGTWSCALDECDNHERIAAKKKAAA